MLTLPSSCVVQFQPKSQPERFLMLRHSLLLSPLWQELHATTRAVYVDLASKYTGHNNGSIAYGARNGEAMGISKDTTSRHLGILEDVGLIVCRRRGSHKEAKASEWELPYVEQKETPLYHHRDRPPCLTRGTGCITTGTGCPCSETGLYHHRDTYR
jgi:hypothetical protein